MRNMKFLTIAGLTVALAGCGTLPTNTSMYSVHQPVVERTNYAIDISTSGNGVSPVEQRRVSEWFDGLDLGYGDRVALDYGNGYSDITATEAISKLAAERGVLMASPAPVTTGQIAPGNIRVVVTRSTASVPSCPNWSSTHENNYNAGTHSNHGCATNSNLAAMVADPEDLVRGRDNKKLDTNSGKNAVTVYRTKTGGN